MYIRSSSSTSFCFLEVGLAVGRLVLDFLLLLLLEINAIGQDAGLVLVYSVVERTLVSVVSHGVVFVLCLFII